LSASGRRSDRGQIQQVFLFITAIVVIIATIFLGGRLLGLFQGTACSVTDAGFAQDLSALVTQNSAFGSRNTVSVDVPCDAQALYLIDAEADLTQVKTGDATIDTALENGVRANLFVIVDGVAQQAGYDERIIINRAPGDALQDPPFLIINEARGRFSVRTEGFGRRVRVEAP
jgi:hypothetical protein